MKESIALSDWDGTVSKGFMLFRFLDKLVREGLFPVHYKEKMFKLHEDYSEGKIPYHTLTVEVPRIYAQGLKGLEHNRIVAAANSFLDDDQSFLYSHAGLMFSMLREKGINTAIISGAPAEALLLYKEKFGIKYVYGLQAKYENGIYTGEIEINPSLVDNKAMLADAFKRNEKYEIVLAAGDTSSDIPLFETAPNCIVVNNPEIVPMILSEKRILNVCTEDNEPEQIIKFLNLIA
ncbi:MAG: HAD family hydrolase [Ignavibacteriales bacterium]